MSLFQTIKGLDQKFSWSFFGVVLAVLFGLFGIYTAFIYEKKPKLLFQVLSQAPVYSLAENVSNLDIIFDGEDIRKKKQTLTLLTLRIINLGSATIRKGDFDDQNPPSISISDTRVIKCDIVDASDDDLRKTVKINQLPDNRFAVSPAIIEPNEFVLAKFLLLHDQTNQPKLVASGKVAGCKRIEVLNLLSTPARLTFWTRVAGGSAYIQGLRLLIYFVGTLLSVILALAFSTYMSNRLRLAARTARASKYRRAAAYPLTPAELHLLDKYTAKGEQFVEALNRIIHDPQKLHAAAQLADQIELSEREGKAPERTRYELNFFEMPDVTAFKYLVEEAVINPADNHPKVPATFQAAVEDFTVFISALAPKRLKLLRRASAPYGTESAPVKDPGLLPGTQTQATPND